MSARDFLVNVRVVPIWLLGLPAEALLIQRLLQATNGVLFSNPFICVSLRARAFARRAARYVVSVAAITGRPKRA